MILLEKEIGYIYQNELKKTELEYYTCARAKHDDGQENGKVSTKQDKHRQEEMGTEFELVAAALVVTG
uniref:Ovule protein n=1 Tax=Syphacia muris TaxID=451379 RepID=A0A0N5AJL5_9BILA